MRLLAGAGWFLAAVAACLVFAVAYVPSALAWPALGDAMEKFIWYCVDRFDDNWST